MAGSKEIRTKIKSVQSTRKITKAMEMVAASKMRKAQDRMRAARPYAEKVRNIAAHMSQANPEYKHPFVLKRETVKNIAIIMVSTDKGLCGGMNTNIMRMTLNKVKEAQANNVGVFGVAIGSKGVSFMNRIGVKLVSQAVQLGDRPVLEKLIGPVKVALDMFEKGEVDAVYLGYTDFINTMKQEPRLEQLLPLSADRLQQSDEEKRQYGWDYLYEPDAATVVDELMVRYVEALVYQAVAENMASEQSARMVAMKAASDNAKKVIEDLQLVYNKSRQAAITKELSEIVSGAAAV